MLFPDFHILWKQIGLWFVMELLLSYFNKSRYFHSILFFNCLVNNIKQSSIEPLYNGHLLDRRKWSFKSGWNKCEGMNCPPKMADNEWERIDLSTVIQFLTWTCSKGKSVESAGERSLKLFIYLFITDSLHYITSK